MPEQGAGVWAKREQKMLQRSIAEARARRRLGEGGMTLIELLVVVAILGILAGIVVFAVGGIADRGEESADKTTCATLHTAEEAYYAENTEYVWDGGGADPADSGQQQLIDAG